MNGDNANKNKGQNDNLTGELKNTKIQFTI